MHFESLMESPYVYAQSFIVISYTEQCQFLPKSLCSKQLYYRHDSTFILSGD